MSIELALRHQIVELQREVENLTRERDEARHKAVEISHLSTYASEQSNHRGLHIIKD